MRIDENVFVVTGGGNGIGRQVVLELLRRGARVAAVDLNQRSLEETERIAGGRARYLSIHSVNVTDRAALDDLAGTVTARHGQVDGIINVAGIIHRFVPLEALTVDELKRVMDVNFWGTVNMCEVFMPILQKRPSAGIVNISSLSALIPFSGQSFYGASKAAVKQFSEGLYQELSGTHISVTTVFPGNISTNLSGNSGVTMIDAGGRKVRATTPEAAAHKIVEGLARGSFRVLVGTDAHVLDAMVRIAPRLATDFIGKQMRSVLAPSR
ncbi:SDR family NAD(P)-dependent oxidoreductase [Arthrobacter sp. MDT2-16]